MPTDHPCASQDETLKQLLSNESEVSDIIVPIPGLRDFNFGVIIWALGAIIPAGIVLNTINCLIFSRLRRYNRGFCAPTGYLFHTLAIVDILYLVLVFFISFLPCAFLNIPGVPCLFLDYVKVRIMAERYVTMALEGVRMGALWVFVVCLLERIVAVHDPARAPSVGICQCSLIVVFCSCLVWCVLDFVWTEILGIVLYNYKIWAFLITLGLPCVIICFTTIPLIFWLCAKRGSWHKYPPELAEIQGAPCVTARCVATSAMVILFNVPLVVEKVIHVFMSLDIIKPSRFTEYIHAYELVALLFICMLAAFKFIVYTASGEDFRFELGCHKTRTDNENG
ncbi:uncharacterized protein LOC135498910 [Lineus longissimus]|uniref:uncharacterized protein LOC135498910 n=1 Tax=Lineus longissimus TaxID=88925 RepID=UPI002B4ED13A